MDQEMYSVVRAELGPELLARVLRRSTSSLLMYASGRRPTPELIELRLAWAYGVLCDLAGGYNSSGMQRWFERPRVQLGQWSPLEILGYDWRPSDKDVMTVADLAATLAGDPSTCR